MTIKYKATGKERKKLAQAIAEHLDRELEYKGAPTFAYQIDYFTVDREGSLIFDDRADSEEIENLLEYLNEQGFELADAIEDDINLEIAVEIDADDTETYDKTQDIITSKQTLLKHAFDIERPNIERVEGGINFPWFKADCTPEENLAYRQFVAALVKMAKNAKRVVAKEREVDNEKYAFRCFLLRLGFIGDEYKTSRKILLRNFAGSSSYKTPKEAE
ncbi:MAG: virulence protein [Clostridia bacterium]|nr:virulence protein [Clostridia bacterium]